MLKREHNGPWLLVAVLLLSGCAGYRLHNDGMSLLQNGNTEEGLAKLEQAAKAEPDNLIYRADLARSRAQAVNRLMSNASGERAIGHVDAAKAIYDQVLKLDPDNNTAQAAITALSMEKRHDALLEEARDLFAKKDMPGARSALKPILLESPRHGQALLLQHQIDEQETKAQLAEPSLEGKFKKPISLQFRDANVKMVFEALSRTSGINVLLDKDVRSDIKTSIFVKDVSVADAIDLILLQSQLEKKILSDNTVYIYPSTPAKLKDFQDLKIRSFHLTNADPKQMLTMIKTLLKTKDIFIHEKTSSLVMRDTPEAIKLAEKLIADQDIADPEVMLEVEVLEISRSRLTDLGIKYPSQLSFTPIPSLVDAPGATGTAAAKMTQLTLDSLRKINGSNIAVSPIPSITLNAMLQDSDTNILSSPRLRVRNREKAKIMIGERVPIITNSVTPITGGTGSVVTGTVSYQDVGLKLDVEPEIHLDNEVSIKIGLEVSSLGTAITNSAGSQAYRVGTRNTATALRLSDGETQILAGLITDEDRSTADKIPGLGQMPVLGHLFSSNNGNKSKTEIVLSITPHIVGNYKLPNAREMEYWSGTESTLRSNQLLLNTQGMVSLSGNSPIAAAPTTRVLPPAVPRAPAAVTPQVASATDSAVATSPSTLPLVLSWQGPKQAKVGDKLMLTLNTSTAQGAKALAFQVAFDPAVLKVVDVTEGIVMKRDGAASNLTKNINQADGSVAIEMLGSGTNEAGNVATLMFEVTAAVPETTISIDTMSVVGANGDALSVNPPAPHVIAVAQ
jgi:general secretion pathway protein D